MGPCSKVVWTGSWQTGLKVFFLTKFLHASSQPRMLILQVLPASRRCMWPKRTALFAGVKMLGSRTCLWTASSWLPGALREDCFCQHDLCWVCQACRQGPNPGSHSMDTEQPGRGWALGPVHKADVTPGCVLLLFPTPPLLRGH